MTEYLRNAWYLAAWSADVKPGEVLARTLLERPMVFFRSTSGDVVAMDDRCPHRFAPLSMGRVEGDRLICGYHGLEFNTSGACVRNPHGAGRVPRTAQVPTHHVVERHGGVWLWTGWEEPNPALIPDFSLIDTEDNVTRRDHLVMDVPYDLIIDNLMDCSHTSFLHEGILGTAEMLPARTEVVQDGNTVRAIRRSDSAEPPGMFDMLYLNDGKPVDVWTDIRWDPPCHVLLDVGVKTPGQPREEGAGLFGIHILTPETATTTHYHTTAKRWGIREGTETDEIRIKVADMRRTAFADQDEPMIEAQHRNMAAFSRLGEELKPLIIETDAGVVRWHQVMEKLLATERASPRS
jgi:phenylpropionate dioxygenase-like ring-hydroxylating dioxygenase large terminal subunit